MSIPANASDSPTVNVAKAAANFFVPQWVQSMVGGECKLLRQILKTYMLFVVADMLLWAYC